VAINTEDWLKLVKRAVSTQDCRADDADFTVYFLPFVTVLAVTVMLLLCH
jgi:hypothetical protein